MAVFQCAPKVISGHGSLKYLQTLTPRRVLVVTDSYFSESGIASKVASLLPDAQTEIFDRVVSDPPATLAAEGAALCRTWEPELLLALGGGSVIDCAKGIKAAVDGSLSFVAIPTTSGSGSEMTSYAILTKDHVKYPLIEESLRPDVTILDGDLLKNLPPSLIADTGMDMLAHCIEALGAVNHSGFTDALAICGIQTVFRSLVKSFRGDASVRQSLHEASSMAGLAFEHAGLGLCHGLAHSLGGMFPVPHGRLCAILLPAVMRFNGPAVQDRYALAAASCGLSAATERLAVRNLLAEICRLRRELRLPETLLQAGIEKEMWVEKRSLVIEATLADPCCRTNPVPVTSELVADVLKVVAP